jgi:hypothetical protein
VIATDAVRRNEVLTDSEATLRQVEDVLAGLSPRSDTAAERHERVDRVVSTLESRSAGLKDLVWVLVNTYAEITSVIDSLRRSRGLLEQAAMERLKSTHERLAEVTSATELAATGMLDGLDRALTLVDRMESGGAGTDPEARDALRDELHSLYNLLQFQDITSQQLGYADAVLLDIEGRMMELARVFDFRWLGLDGEEEPPTLEEHTGFPAKHVACDPAASHFGAESRQALADEIFR